MHSPWPATTTHTAVGSAAQAASESRVPDSNSTAENGSVAKPDVALGTACAQAAPAWAASIASASVSTNPNWRIAGPSQEGAL
jgi:hypothetical protein